ncbi:MAG: RNA 2',3'-cyclic phosphodiesterase [Desulfurococcaceae archaeon]
MSELIRTFIAIEVENREVLEKLVEVRNQLLESGADIKPVEDKNIHLTIKFIGEVPQSTVELLCSEISKIKYPRFYIHIKGIGAFPTEYRPRVIWAGVEEGSDKVVDLFKVVDSIARKIKITGEKEEFTPHITIARVKTSKNVNRLVAKLRDLANVDFGNSNVSGIHVKRSVLTPSGPIYSNLCSVYFS